MREWARTTWRAIGIYIEIDGDLRAASFAFYAFFSLFPIMVLTVSVGSRFLAPEAVTRVVIGYVDTVIPLNEEDAAAVYGQIERVMTARAGLGLLAVAGLLWASNHFFRALVRGVNRAWHTTELDWWKVPLKNFAMLGIFAVALLVGVLAPLAVGAVSRVVPLDMAGMPVVTVLLRFVVPTAVLFLGICMLYKLSPRRRVLFREVWLAALLATGGLKLLQQLLLYYTSTVWQVNALYGALGVLVVLLLWAYLCGVILLFGGCLCAAIHGERVRRENTGYFVIGE